MSFFPPNTTTIGSDCFNYDKKLTTVTPFLPDTVTSIGEEAFRRTKLEGDLRLKSMEVIQYRAFYTAATSSNGITSVWMPNVTNVESLAFNSPVLSNVVFGADQVHFYYWSDAKTCETGNCTFATAKPCNYYFPGKAPDLPFTCVSDGRNCTGYNTTFSSQSGGPGRLHGSWKLDRPGWTKIMNEVGRDVDNIPSSYDIPEKPKGVRSIKGVVYYPSGSAHTGVRYAWLYDWKCPEEPPSGLTFLIQ